MLTGTDKDDNDDDDDDDNKDGYRAQIAAGDTHPMGPTRHLNGKISFFIKQYLKVKLFLFIFYKTISIFKI